MTTTEKSADSTPASFCAVTVYLPALAGLLPLAVNFELSGVVSTTMFLHASTGLPFSIQLTVGFGDPDTFTWRMSREPVFTVWVDSSFLS